MQMPNFKSFKRRSLRRHYLSLDIPSLKSLTDTQRGEFTLCSTNILFAVVVSVYKHTSMRSEIDIYKYIYKKSNVASLPRFRLLPKEMWHRKPIYCLYVKL